ncbi:hypothetical protein [Candidatus Proelusimicrobium volucris]|uniref:hypothetical protein n=1 Tax=Candidatus Proelusimicrobium volucris TaxID=3416225 RepID=UPI003D096219
MAVLLVLAVVAVIVVVCVAQSGNNGTSGHPSSGSVLGTQGIQNGIGTQSGTVNKRKFLMMS